MNATRRDLIMQRWNAIHHELLPELRNDVGKLTPKLEKVIHILEWVRIEEFFFASWCGEGRPPHERSWLANAFIAKVVLRLTTTRGLIERLTIDRVLRRICGFLPCKKLPSESTFSRAFDEFAESRLAERVHEALIKEHLGDELIGHISRDGTAIPARERPRQAQAPVPQTTATMAAGKEQTALAQASKRGRPRRGEVRLMDAAYCSTELREHSRSLGHVPLIDHNPRRGEKIEFAPAQAIRYNERTAAERSDARLKDEFGGNTIMVKGDAKVMGHLMFGVLALSADQLMRLQR